MKRAILILIVFAIVLPLGAQTLEPRVIASAGGYDEDPGVVSISWTLGETIIPTFQDDPVTPTIILTHGFQQQLIITTVQENLEIFVNVTIYPNPASEALNIRFEEALDGAVDLVLLSQDGKLVKRDIIEAATIEKQLNMQDLPAGIYFLRLIKGKLSNVYKVVRL